jgi:hypothetical protein
MSKLQHMCYGQCLGWVTDCYAAKFILSYYGAIQAILRLQMQLVGWDVDIVHQHNDHLVDADYWSCLDCDLCYDPSFCNYLHFVKSFCTKRPPPTEIPINAKHMPYYRGLRVHELQSLHNTSD